MNMIKAMQETIKLAEERLNDSSFKKNDLTFLDQNLKIDHLKDMLELMESDINPNNLDRNFSEGKLGRWLGWAQASCVAMGLFTLEEMKELNKNS